jgi:hypothetical protein
MKLKGKIQPDFSTWYCNQDYEIHLIDFLELPIEFQFGVYQLFLELNNLNLYIIRKGLFYEGYINNNFKACSEHLHEVQENLLTDIYL